MKRIKWMILVTLLLAGANVYASEADRDTEIMKLDTNKDGKVSFEEYKSAHEADMLEHFRRKDLNQDGVIDSEEKQVAKTKLKETEHAEKEAERQALREQYQKERKQRRKHFYKYQ